MKRTFALLLLGVVFYLGLLPRSFSFGEGKDLGRILYEEKCVICHGASGKGDGPAAAALTPPPKDLNRPEFWKQNNVEQIIANQVKHGHGSMPAFSFSEDEIKAIIEFMSGNFNRAK